MNGDLMRTEMGEQPEVLARLIARRAETIARVRAVMPTRPAGVLLVARGSSDNAALHARYLMELATGRPAALAAPSLWTRYGASTMLSGWAAVAVSQSGRTPEIIDTVQQMRRVGAAVISVTNDENSDLAAVSDATIALEADAELAVPATKTVTASVMALVHVAAGLGELPWGAEAEHHLPQAVEDILRDETAVGSVLDTIPGLETVHVGRGYTLSVALEAALKMQETTTQGARGYATGDFLHGPIAAVGPQSAVFGYAAAGPTYDDVTGLLSLTRERGIASVLVTDQSPVGVGGTDVEPQPVLSVPAGLPEPLVAMLLIVRAQQLAFDVTRRAGLDPDRPRGLSKVTITR